MYQPKLEKDIRCPLEYGLDIFGGKWKSRIIRALAAKEVLRYSQLRHEMGNITDAFLAVTLKELQRDEIVLRKSYDEIPPTGGVPVDRKGEVCDSDFAEHLSVGRSLSQAGSDAHMGTLPEV